MDNFTCAVRFEKPDDFPMTFSTNNACPHQYPKEELGAATAAPFPF